MVAAITPIGSAVDSGRARRGSAANGVNVHDVERWASVVAGGLAVVKGLTSGSLFGLGLAAVGGGLLYRGLTGHCPMYAALDVNTAQRHNPLASVGAGEGVKVNCTTTVNRSAEELYRLWRNLEALPRFMSHLVSVKNEGNRSHWVARAPAGFNVEWDAEIINEEPGKLLAWRSLEGSQVGTAGSVHFMPAPGGRGTEVRVTLKYDPPGGKLGSWVAWLFGEEPRQQIEDDLRRFKQMAEAGEIATVAGQPSGRF